MKKSRRLSDYYYKSRDEILVSVTVRMSRSLHKRIIKKAKEEGRSVTRQIEHRLLEVGI